MDSGRDPADWQGPSGCGDTIWAYIFFTLFQLLVTQIYINLTIAIIVDAFTGVTTSDKLPVQNDLMNLYVECWSTLDPNATGYIKVTQVEDLLKELYQNEKCRKMLYFKGAAIESHQFCLRLVGSLEIPTFGQFKRVMFYDVLQQLCYRSFKIQHNQESIKKHFNLLKAAALMQRKSLLSINTMNTRELLNTEFDIDFDDETFM